MVNDSAAVVFDDERAVANAGVMLPAALAAKLGIEPLVEECLDLGEGSGTANPGRHFAVLTNRTEPLALVEAEHPGHAVVELAIRDLKDQALAHFPSGKFNANAAWAAIAPLAWCAGRVARPARRDGARGPHPASTAARAAGPAHPHGQALYLALAGALALARGLHRGARADQGPAPAQLPLGRLLTPGDRVKAR